MGHGRGIEIFVRECSPFFSGASLLIDLLDEYQRGLYPAESNHLHSRGVLSGENCRFVAAFIGDDVVGIGAAKIFDGYGELKRFFVLEEYRGLGVAECLIADLEKWLVGRGVRRACFETGVRQLAALRFYQKLGYQTCAPFGAYQLDPLSVFMTKELNF